jgi:hypothetical protein
MEDRCARIATRSRPCCSSRPRSAFPAAASAQQDEPDRNVTVQDRPRPDYDPIGIRAGSFFFYPSVGLQGLYDSNIFATDDEEDDFASILTPRIQVKSNFSRHSLAFDVGGESAFYLDENDNNYNDVYARGAGQLEITRNNLLNGNIAVSRLHEDRDSPDESGADEITEYQNHLLGLSYRRNFARVFGILGGELRRFDFEDTDDINNDDRDRSQYLARARVGYEVSPRLDGFVEGTVDARRYDETPDDIGRDRDSEGYSLRAGADIDLTGIVFGELSAGYSRRKYDDDELDTVTAQLRRCRDLERDAADLGRVRGAGGAPGDDRHFEGEEATGQLPEVVQRRRHARAAAQRAAERERGLHPRRLRGRRPRDDSLLLGRACRTCSTATCRSTPPTASGRATRTRARRVHAQHQSASA